MPERYRMDIEFVHHALSGWGGEATVVPKADPAGEWVRFDAGDGNQQPSSVAVDPAAPRTMNGATRDPNCSHCNELASQLKTAEQEREKLTKAETFYEAQRTAMMLEDAMDDEVIVAMGIDPESPKEWPFGNLVYDDYDSSFELHGTRVDWKPSQANLMAAWALGFARCWVVYVDGNERYYTQLYPLGDLKPSGRGGASEATRRERHLAKQLSTLLAAQERLIAEHEALKKAHTRVDNLS